MCSSLSLSLSLSLNSLMLLISTKEFLANAGVKKYLQLEINLTLNC